MTNKCEAGRCMLICPQSFSERPGRVNPNHHILSDMMFVYLSLSSPLLDYPLCPGIRPPVVQAGKVWRGLAGADVTPFPSLVPGPTLHRSKPNLSACEVGCCHTTPYWGMRTSTSRPLSLS